MLSMPFALAATLGGMFYRWSRSASRYPETSPTPPDAEALPPQYDSGPEHSTDAPLPETVHQAV